MSIIKKTVCDICENEITAHKCLHKKIGTYDIHICLSCCLYKFEQLLDKQEDIEKTLKGLGVRIK